METRVARSLSNVQLHIESVLPHASLTSYEAKKATLDQSNNTTSTQHQHHHHTDKNEHGDPQLQQLQQQEDVHDHDHTWTDQQIVDRNGWMNGFKPNKKGGLIYLDHDALKKQQGVFKDVMVQVGSQLLTGKLAVRISLPIRIFEARTLLERVADGWNYAPTLLTPAARTSDPLERLKYVMAFVVGGFHFCVGQLKPFNPILGETYEATYADGTQIFMEHVAHHPVQSAFHVRGPNGFYAMHGVYEFESVTSRNSIYNHQIGKTTIRFHDGQCITYTLPQIKMSGLLFGERVVEITGVATFTDEQNALTGELTFNANSGGFLFGKTQADDIRGHIKSTRKGAKHSVAVQGAWLTHLHCDGKAYWQVESEPAFAHRPVDHPLPSDCRYRHDLVALQQGNLALAQSEKVRLEELQRSDRKLREEASTIASRRASKC